MNTLEALRRMRIEELQTKIRQLQNEMATFVVTRTTDEDEYLADWRAVDAMQTELQELKDEQYAELASLLGPAT